MHDSGHLIAGSQWKNVRNLSFIKVKVINKSVVSFDLQHSGPVYWKFNAYVKAVYKLCNTLSCFCNCDKLFSNQVLIIINICSIWQIAFCLKPGPSRRFKRLCEYFQAILISPSRSHAAARRISSDLASNTSSSSSYNSIDGISPTPTDEVCMENLSLLTNCNIISIYSVSLCANFHKWSCCNFFDGK